MAINHTIGVLSDTHGILPSFVVSRFRNRKVKFIFHVGDIGDTKILSTLEQIAPTTWVRGNMDDQSIGKASEVVQINGLSFYLLHNLYDLDLDPAAAGIFSVIHGHLHVPSIEWRNDTLFLNPGSCAHPRQGHPPSCAIITIQDQTLLPEIIFK